MDITDSLLHALLVCCDQSYNPNPVLMLAPYWDSGPPGNVNQADSYPASMPVAWNQDLQGWQEVNRIDDAGTGFGAVVYGQPSGDGVTFNYIVALQGTRGLNPQDWYGNLTYGWDKFRSSTGGQQLINYLTTLSTAGPPGILDTTNKISFTGQSLGGALAQYVAYEYYDIRNNVLTGPGSKISAQDMSIVTFNGLGALDGLKTNYESLTGRAFDPTLLNGVSTAYYWVPNDLVSALGGGNVNDANGTNDYRLNFNTSPSQSTALGIADAHHIESGFYAGFNQYGGDFSTDATRAPITPINVENMAAIGTAWANLFNNDYTADPEATARLMTAVLVGVAAAPISQSNILVDAVLDRWWATVQPGSVSYYLLKPDYLLARTYVGAELLKTVANTTPERVRGRTHGSN